MLSCQAFQLPGQLFRLPGQLPLPLSSTANLILEVGCPTAHALVFLLLAPGKLLQLLQRGVQLLIDLLLLTALNALVLVLHLVQLELEEIGEVLGVGSLTATSAATTSLAHLYLTEGGLGSLQMLQGPLRRRQGFPSPAGTELFLGCEHLFGSRRKLLDDLGEPGVRLHHTAILNPPNYGLYPLAQATLRKRKSRHVFLILLIRILIAIANHLEGRRDDLPLLLGELTIQALTTPTSSPTLIRLAVVATKRPDAHEIDVGRDRPPASDPVVVRHLGVVRDQITRLETQLLEVEGVCGRHLLGAPVAVEQIERIFRIAVDRIDQLQRPQAVIVLCADLDEHLFDRRNLDIPPGFLEPDRRRLVVERIDEIVW